jgi:hypothetical protein
LSTSFYDVSIWEEIRSIVCRKIDRLVESINKEIPKDTSLAEFQGKHPIPFQLREIMQQRANVWVQRLYDLCCDAYKSRGKTLSADLDRAVWAYCVEPFIMGETDSQIHDQTMGGFLNLLLCAVGSPPEKRPSLKVSQKQCCFDVRTKVYETWYDKLHHLPPRINEAVAALARFNAMERRAARIVRGLPPDDPPPPPSEAPPSTIEAPIDTPPAVPESDLQPAAADFEEAASLSQHELSQQPNAEAEGGWEQIEITFLSDERVQIRGGKNIETRNYAEFGFQDGRSKNPNRAWETLRRLAELRGIIRDGAQGRLPWPKVEKRVQEIRKVFREHFGVSSDPLPFVEGTGYQARFKICCGPSYRT